MQQSGEPSVHLQTRAALFEAPARQAGTWFGWGAAIVGSDRWHPMVSACRQGGLHGATLVAWHHAMQCTQQMPSLAVHSRNKTAQAPVKSVERRCWCMQRAGCNRSGPKLGHWTMATAPARAPCIQRAMRSCVVAAAMLCWIVPDIMATAGRLTSATCGLQAGW